MDSGEILLRRAWRSFSGRLAVAGGSFVGLLSLFHHVPASTAAARGAATTFAMLVIAKLGGAALQRSAALDRSRGGGKSDQGSSG